MKEIIYTFDNRGCYISDKTAMFEAQSHIRLIIKPHEFELKISDEIIRSSSCKGYIVDVSYKGEVCFYDFEKNLLAKASETQMEFAEVRCSWKSDLLSLEFGRVETVDYYPNCDGEYDRWGKEWVAQYSVTLETKNNSIVIG